MVPACKSASAKESARLPIPLRRPVTVPRAIVALIAGILVALGVAEVSAADPNYPAGKAAIKSVVYDPSLNAQKKVQKVKIILAMYENQGTTTTSPTTTSSTTTTPTTTTSTTTTTQPSGCDLNASPSTFSSVLAGASDGQTICLATGNYGTFQGTSKAVTIKAADGASPAMQINLASGDANFTIDGLRSMGGDVGAGVHDVTIRNSTFSSWIDFYSGPTPNFVLDHDTFNNIDSPRGAPNARVGLHYGGSTPSGVTLENSLLSGGDSDGVHTGVAVNVIDNEFANICEGPSSYNHTDAMQFEGSLGGVVRGNYFHDRCSGQMLTSYDGGTQGVLIEGNVLDTLRPAALEFYSDDGSIIRHNTLVWHPPSQCEYSQNCGQIDLNRKAADPAGRNTQVYDNVTTGVGVNNGSTVARSDHNVSGVDVPYVGGATPNTYSGFHLAPGSVGVGAASDGTNVGIR